MTQADCIIAGCGPAGAMLGFLLARAGVRVLVLEKHGDFLRDFRGDTIHPSTLEILDQLGLADKFLLLPHSELATVEARTLGDQVLRFSFERLRSRFRFIAFVPQWDFLRFMTAEARRYSGFDLKMNAEVTDLIFENGAVCGVRYNFEGAMREARATLTVGTDGRTSITRERAALPMRETSSPIDVLWFRLSRKPHELEALAARIGAGQMAVLINRREYWQIAYVIHKGQGDKIRAAGVDSFRALVLRLLPEMQDRAAEISDMDQVKLLTVRSDRLTRWYRRGYLAIGDAAHAMSPIAGVGINVAIQDAVCAANVLWEPLRNGFVAQNDLARIQDDRELTVRATQAVQSVIQTGLLGRILRSEKPFRFPPAAMLLQRIPILRDIPPRLVAFGGGRPRVRSPRLPPR